MEIAIVGGLIAVVAVLFLVIGVVAAYLLRKKAGEAPKLSTRGAVRYLIDEQKRQEEWAREEARTERVLTAVALAAPDPVNSPGVPAKVPVA